MRDESVVLPLLLPLRYDDDDNDDDDVLVSYERFGLSSLLVESKS